VTADGGERLQRLLSRAKVCSRRRAEELILAGRVTVNGVPAVLGQRVRAHVDAVQVDGRAVRTAGTFDYIALHKPVGYLSTRRDDRGRPTVMDLVAGSADIHVYPVGRLDLDSSGLILLTNDGELAQRLQHPSHEVVKVYRVRVSRPLGADELRAFAEGMHLDGRRTAPARIRRIPGARCPQWYEVRLREGRNRQIRRMLALLGVDVEQLVRVAMGPLSVRGIPPGCHRRLDDEEVKALRAGSSGRQSITSKERRRGPRTSR